MAPLIYTICILFIHSNMVIWSRQPMTGRGQPVYYENVWIHCFVEGLWFSSWNNDMGIFWWEFFIYHVKYFYEYIMNQKCFFFTSDNFFGDVYHQVALILPGGKSNQRNTAENHLDLNAPLCRLHIWKYYQKMCHYGTFTSRRFSVIFSW